MSEPHSKLSKTAARWYILMRDAASDAPERAEFECWLQASTAYQAEYESLTQSMQALADNGSLAKISSALKNSAASRALQIRKTVIALAGAFMVGLTALFSVQQYQTWQAAPVMQLAAANPVGQISTQTLEDGSRVTLSAHSEMQITFYRHQRHVQLNHGEAIFEVTKDPKRPFVVAAGNVEITVLGTRFAVNKLSKLVRVSLDHGRVQIVSKEPQAGLILTDGQVAEIFQQAAPKRIKRNAADAFTFVQGKLVFESADIAEIAETLSRYRQTPVVAQGQSARNISAVINTRDGEEFLQGLPRIAPVIVRQTDHQTVLVTK